MKKEEKNTHPILIRPSNLGQRAADKLTKLAGSWGFILIFILVLIAWILLNTSMIFFKNFFDPKPFDLLNLLLSFIAGIQAPIILMSQNRAAQKDRQRAEYDYNVDRKSEKEIEEIKKQLNRIEKKIK